MRVPSPPLVAQAVHRRRSRGGGVGRDRLTRSDLVAPFTGVRIPAPFAALEPVDRARLALLACGDQAFLSGPSAAIVIGMPVPMRLLGKVEVSVPAPGRAIRRRGIRGRVLAVRARGTHLMARSPHDCAGPHLVRPRHGRDGPRTGRGRRLAPPWGLANADSLARSGSTRAPADRRGIGRIRTALSMLDPRSESPKESELRAIVILGGLPAPRPNVEIRRPDGRFVARVDLLFEEYGEILEYHGDHHRTDRRQWRRDRTREAELEALGHHVMEVTDDDLGARRARRADRTQPPAPGLDAVNDALDDLRRSTERRGAKGCPNRTAGRGPAAAAGGRAAAARRRVSGRRGS